MFPARFSSGPPEKKPGLLPLATRCPVSPPFGGVAPLPGYASGRPEKGGFFGVSRSQRSFFSFQSFFLDLFRHRLARAECDDIFFRDVDGFAGQRISRLIAVQFKLSRNANTSRHGHSDRVEYQLNVTGLFGVRANFLESLGRMGIFGVRVSRSKAR